MSNGRDSAVEAVARALARHDDPKKENWWPSYESRARAAVAAMPAPHPVYLAAFYDVAKLLGISARVDSPAVVWECEMLPRLKRALTPVGQAPASDRPDYEAAWHALSEPLSWMHDHDGLKAYWGWNLADIANDLIDRAYPGLRAGKPAVVISFGGSLSLGSVPQESLQVVDRPEPRGLARGQDREWRQGLVTGLVVAVGAIAALFSIIVWKAGL